MIKVSVKIISMCNCTVITFQRNCREQKNSLPLDCISTWNEQNPNENDTVLHFPHFSHKNPAIFFCFSTLTRKNYL